MRHSPNAIMLFAAGFGTRMGDLTAHRPKPLIPVAGKPLIDHALDRVAPLSLSTVVVNTFYKGEMIASHLADRDVQISHEEPDILETGGGLRHALPLLGRAPVFTMNTDAVWRGPEPLLHLAQAWDPTIMDALLLCIPLARVIGHDGNGDFAIATDGQLTRGDGWVYSGAQIIKTDMLNEISEPAFSLNVLWDRMAGDGKLFGVSYPGTWCDVGHPEGITLAEDMLKTHDV